MQEDPPIDGAAPDDEKEPIEAAVIARAVEQLRAVAKGNGLISGQITDSAVEGETLNFEGLGFFKIEAKNAEKRVAGKQKGVVLGSASEMHQKMQAAKERAAHNPDVRHHTIAVLKKRRDRGFMVKNQYISLDSLRQNFVVHEGCNPCGRKGKLKCNICGGQGRSACKKCFGTKLMPCPLCRGTKTIGSPEGRVPCTRCRGKGRAPCNMCQRSGAKRCVQCQGVGTSNCKNCNGTGWHSLVGSLTIRAHGTFDFDRERLPPEIAEKIDEKGPLMVIENHADAHIIEDEERAQELAQIAKDDEYIIPYHVRLPVGRITFAMPKKQEISATLFGMQPVMTGLPAFLEEPLAPSLAALQEAATGSRARLREAMKARFVSEYLLTTLKHGRGKAQKIMTKRYPYGLSAETIAATAQTTENVVKGLVTRPRLVGLGIGSAVAAALYAAYFIGPLNAMVMAMVPDMESHIEMALDAAVFMTGAAAAAVAAQQMATNGVRKALGKVAAKIPPGQLAPASAFSYVTGTIIAALLFIGMIEGAVEMKKPAPHWYMDIRMQVTGHPAISAQDAENETAAPGTGVTP